MSTMKLLYRFLIRKKAFAVGKVVAMMAHCPTRQDKERYQVDRFNAVWKIAWKNVPYYRNWKATYELPDAINDLRELKHWPILTKADLRKIEDFIRKDVPYPRGRILTGGSTGVPVRLPSWGDTMSGVSQIIGRQEYGVEIGDRTFLLWGHEHLFGNGIRRWAKIGERRIKDFLAGWRRVSAYDLSRKAIERAYAKFVRFRPQVVIGYSPSILAFCRMNRPAKPIDGVKVVICSAGPLSQSERAEVSGFFNARVCMEYGSVECGVMAYTRPEDECYHVFWNTHLLQVHRDEHGQNRNLVTRLIDSYIPLIHYDVGDYLELDGPMDANESSVLVIKDVKGRPSEFLKFKCGVSLFAWGVGDCVKQAEKVIDHQLVVCEMADDLLIRVVSREKMVAEDFAIIRNRLTLTVSGVDKLRLHFEQVDKLQVADSGKTPRVIREEGNDKTSDC